MTNWQNTPKGRSTQTTLLPGALVTPELAEGVRGLAMADEVPVSEVIRRALAEYLAKREATA